MGAITDNVDSPLVSIVIPCRNEAQDIAATLDACLALDYERKEIIVVDDSTDESPRIIAQYAGRGVRLIHRDKNRNGCCGARNEGMREARGEIIVLVNADNRPRPDFIRRILTHYRDGADYVVVQSTVVNRDNVWAQYIYAIEVARPEADPTWSEGFSCRREAARAVGYIPGDFPIPFCRDVAFGRQLQQAGYTKHVDLSIRMEHVSPSTLTGFWHNRVWRGSISAPFTYYMRRVPAHVVVLHECLKAARTVCMDVLVVPPLLRAIRYARYVPARWRAVPSLFAVGLVHDAAVMVGNLQGLMRLLQVEGLLVHQTPS